MQRSVCPSEREVLLDRDLKFKIRNAEFKIDKIGSAADYFFIKHLFLECEIVN